MSFADVIAGWRADADFRRFFLHELAATTYQAFFWEMPPIRRGRIEIEYEYVAIRSESLTCCEADPDAYAAQLNDAMKTVVAFPNLGGDALLVAPRPMAALQTYAHIAAFVRAAPPAQQHALLQTLAGAIDQVLDKTERPIWISTSGLGVAWLHVRLDTWPKYYQHRPYAVRVI